MQQSTTISKELKSIKLLTDEQVDQICNAFEEEVLLKNSFFLEAGSKCKKVGFLTTGILCSFIYDSEGVEVVKHFLEPPQFFTDMDSYVKNQPAKLNIMALTDALVLSIRKKENQQLQEQIPEWEYVQGLFASRALNHMVQMQNFLHFGSAAEKYNYLIKNHPNLARHVPLKYIASYLGITQSSLSRLRRENTL